MEQKTSWSLGLGGSEYFITLVSHQGFWQEYSLNILQIISTTDNVIMMQHERATLKFYSKMAEPISRP